MRYNPVLRKKSRTSRRGIAVMFALGILSLVIVAVLIFSQRAVTDRKVASAYSRYSESRDLAQSAFERALLQFKKNAASGTAFHSVKVGSDDDFDWLWKLDPERRILPRDGSCPVRWQYVRDSDGHIIGRYAYIIIGEKRLNLNAILDHSFCKAGASCDGGSGCLRAQRRGNTAAELQFDPSAFSSIFTFGGGEFNAENLQAVKDGDNVKQYASPEALYPACAPKTGWTDADVRNRINALLNISLSDAVKEPDAWFGGDTNGNGTKDKAEFYQRFRLNRTDWNTVTVNDILKSAEAFYTGESPKPVNSAGIPWLNSWSEKTGNWPDAATKARQIAANLINYCAPETRAVVSDKDPASWSFPNAPAYTGNKRTWYLNECYVKLRVTAETGKTESHTVDWFGIKYWVSYGSGDQPNKIKVELIVKPEIINMYTDVLPGSYSVKVFGDVSFKCDKWSYTDGGTTYTNSEDFESLTYSAGDIFTAKGDGGNLLGGFACSSLTGSSGYKTCYFSGGGGSSSMVGHVNVGGFGEGPFTFIASPDYTKFFKIKNVSIKLKLAVTKDGENVDFVELPEIKADDIVAFDDGGTTVVEKSFSANDPRHNLHAEDWTEQEESLGSANSGLTCTGGAFTEGTGWNQDPETATDPANGTISTAYIRHAPMESIWELGAIHRAAPWQTINLKKPGSCSDTLTTNLTTKGGGAYGEGDFRILDQVTMQGGTAYTPLGLFGKVNLNAPGTSTRRFVFDSLFRKMPWSTSGYARTSTTEVPGDNARVLANKLGTAPNFVKLYRRTDIYQAPSGAAFWDMMSKSPVDGSDLTTDAQQEQLIGRTIGLTTADTTPDSATVIVLAQSIKDMGGNADVYPDWDENGSVSGNTGTDKAKLKAGYYSYAEDGSSITNPGFFPVPSNIPNKVTAKFGRYDNGADRITGETRLVGRLLYDRVQGKWKIVQVQNED